MIRTTHWTGSTSLFLVVALSLFGAACSSSNGDDAASPDSSDVEADASSDEESGDLGDDEGESSSGDFDCDLLAEYAATIRGAGGWVPQVVDQETFEAVDGLENLDKVDAAIEGLRPIQDIDGLFGPVREGLDNLATDVQAIRESRYDAKVGDYNVAGLNAVIADEVCG